MVPWCCAVLLSLIFLNLKIGPPNSPRLLNANCVFVLVGQVQHDGKRPSRGKPSPGMYPLGTAFAVRTPSLTHLLSACHTITDNSDCSRWYITKDVDRQHDGRWAFNTAIQEVTVAEMDKDNDIVVLSAPPFESDDAVAICPADQIPDIKDECLFKTYYCAVEDIQCEPTFPPLEAAPSESKKLYALKNRDNGHLWLRGGLCGGASGGVVVNQQGLAVGMHIASSSSGLTVQNVKENDKREGKKRRGDDGEMSIHSDSIDSLANSHSSTQVVLLLSRNVLVQSLL